MKRFLNAILKFGVTIGIFVAIFLEFGGGYQPVLTASLGRAGAFEASNPGYPGIVGRLRARVRGATLPPARLPASIDSVCSGATEHAVFVRLANGSVERFRPLRHCTAGRLATVYVRSPGGEFTPVPLSDAPATAYFRTQGFQLVPIELSELWTEVRSVRLTVFLPWFLFAVAVKLVGIFANVWRWQILLRGQGIDLRFGFLSSTYFIGRYFGIVTPSTMGLDAWRLYETIRLTRRPVECTTVLAVERVIGLVGLLSVILVFMPFAGRLMQGQSFGELVATMKMPLAAAVIFGVLVLLQPSWFRGLLGVLPGARVRQFAGRVIDAATAYSNRRSHLLLALVLAMVGQITTTLMYFANAMSLAAQNVRTTEVLFASAVMTFGTFVAPSASGEGVRELVFVWLIGSRAGAAKAFLIGNLGFWIEKVPLSIPGGLILLLRRDPTLRAVTREDLEQLQRDAQAERAGSS
jgi:hypothetical protein